MFEFLSYVLSNFWVFLGFIIILTLLLGFIVKMFRVFMKSEICPHCGLKYEDDPNDD